MTRLLDTGQRRLLGDNSRARVHHPVLSIERLVVQKSDADFISKIEGALQELDESDYWLEMLGDGKYVLSTRLSPLRGETDELIAILVTVVRKVKARRR